MIVVMVFVLITPVYRGKFYVVIWVVALLFFSRRTLLRLCFIIFILLTTIRKWETNYTIILHIIFVYLLWINLFTATPLQYICYKNETRYFCTVVV